MIFYWLDSSTECLLPFFHRGMGSQTQPLTPFLTFYADLIKWVDGLTGWSSTVSSAA
jgi:hypothetical protein